jgi:C-terminal processing protease CtpA/Prc
MAHTQLIIQDVSAPVRERLEKQAGPTLSLQAFLVTAAELGIEDRLTLIDQALRLFRDLYVNRPLKEAQLAVQPVRRLELMRLDLERRRRRALARGEDLDSIPLRHPVYFHGEMTEIFTSVRDRHMRYLLPHPFRGSWATLGFEVEAVHGDEAATRALDARRVGAPAPVDRRMIDRDFVVSRVLGEDLDGGRFRPGVKVVSWNGAPIENAVEHNGDKSAGSNVAARHARGLHRLTLRPLWTSPPPQQDWVIIGYEDDTGQLRHVKFDWFVIPSRSAWWSRDVKVVGSVRVPRRPRPRPLRLTESVDQETAALRQLRYQNTRRAVYCSASGEYGHQPVGVPRLEREPVFLQASPGQHPFWGEAYRLHTPDGVFGYLRIFTFEVNREGFAAQLRELLPQLPAAADGTQGGIILDVRDNGGGQIEAGEALLQMLTPRRIEPIRFEFPVNGATFDLCGALQRHRLPGEWQGWQRSIERGSEIGALFSVGYPITPPEALQDRGLYRGPVVLVVNALSYSTTDILAAGFKDHQVGRILSTDDNIGAGGANTASHEDLRRVAGEALGLRPLPHGASMQLALRRAIRVGAAAGTPLEALGIELDERPGRDRRYYMQREDVLYKNVCLLGEAVEMLRERVLPVPTSSS